MQGCFPIKFIKKDFNLATPFDKITKCFNIISLIAYMLAKVACKYTNYGFGRLKKFHQNNKCLVFI